MTLYSYREIAAYIADRLGAKLPESEYKKEGLEVTIDETTLALLPGSLEGEIVMELALGVWLENADGEMARMLMNAHFMGVNTGGCTLALDSSETILYLKATTSPGTPPQESFEWLHRVVNVGREWQKSLTAWEAFMPLQGEK